MVWVGDSDYPDCYGVLNVASWQLVSSNWTKTATSHQLCTKINTSPNWTEMSLQQQDKGERKLSEWNFGQDKTPQSASQP